MGLVISQLAFYLHFCHFFPSRSIIGKLQLKTNDFDTVSDFFHGSNFP